MSIKRETAELFLPVGTSTDVELYLSCLVLNQRSRVRARHFIEYRTRKMGMEYMCNPWGQARCPNRF
jgi:hypothetical protein